MPAILSQQKYDRYISLFIIITFGSNVVHFKDTLMNVLTKSKQGKECCALCCQIKKITFMLNRGDIFMHNK